MFLDFEELLQRVAGNEFWLEYLTRALEPMSRVNIHLAVVSEPFLTFILDGRKTIESRFSQKRCAPFGMIAEGDIILFKEVAGPICGLSIAKQAWYFYLAYESLEAIRLRYEDRICADERFWGERRNSSYASLVSLGQTIAINPVRCEKRDRRGWVLIRSHQLELPF